MTNKKPIIQQQQQLVCSQTAVETKTKKNMDEVFKYQESITNPMRRENDKFSELDMRHNLDEVISKARDYQEKLVNIKRSMLMMRDKTTKLKRRTHRLLEDKNKEDIERQRTRERREILEKHLEPVVNTKRD